LFDFGDVDTSILEKFGQDEDGLFQASGMFNIALHPDGRVEGLKTVSKQVKAQRELNTANTEIEDARRAWEEAGKPMFQYQVIGGNL